MLNSIDIANYFVKTSIKQNIIINNLKLQKLLYYFYAKHLLKNQKNPFDESFEKWQYGPVLPSVYHNYKQYYGADIEEVPDRYIFDENINSFKRIKFDDSEIPKDIRSEIDSFVFNLRNYDAFELVERTHRHDDWKNDEEKIQAGFQHIVYDDNVTVDFFKKHIEEQLWLQAP